MRRQGWHEIRKSDVLNVDRESQNETKLLSNMQDEDKGTCI